VIEVKDLVKRFDGRVVVDHVSVSFAVGEVSAIVGASGSGKSTLLRCLNGLERFDEGSVRVFDHVLSPEGAPPAVLRAVRCDVGMVFQQYGLFAHMTALGNVMEAPVHVRGLARGDARDRARALLEKVGLAGRMSAFPRELSGGEQQRVAIARALAMQPKALLLDEPTSALDPERKRGVVELLRVLAEEGTTMILVTHEPHVVREVASRAVVLAAGKVTADGKPREVLDGRPGDP
jgi:polar amino acid transport system ATP-binding protein